MKRFTISLIAALTLSCVTMRAQSLYWDSNDTTAGAGTDPSGTWGSDSFWSTDSAGTTTPGAWAANATAVFAAGTDATGTYTVSVAAQQTVGGLTFEDGSATLSGGGQLFLT